jgi:hypothetical protein
MTQLYSNGVKLDLGAAAFGELEDSSALLDDSEALLERINDNGYLYLRGFLDPADVLAAREEILLKYAIIGEVDTEYPLNDAVYSASNALFEINLRAFARSLRDGIAYQKVVLNERLLSLHERLQGGEVRAFDFRWPRLARPGEGCGVHCDGPYLTRGSKRIYSSWIPLGDVSKIEGGLMILENGPRHSELLQEYLSMDADRDHLEWLGEPRAVQEKFGTRWLTTDYKAGDVLCFGMNTVHAALDNHSPTKKCRLSSDSRYQLASDSLDKRWNGPDPEAHGRDKVFFPGLGSWNNRDFQDEWKTVDERGRIVLGS